jgi:adenine phosphoribosyltransferase
MPTDPSTHALLDGAIRIIPDFPKPGVSFKDITPLLANPHTLKVSIDKLMDTLKGHKVDKIIALDARGFLFGGAIAARIGAGLIPVRKKGKLPYRTEAVAYDLEYGSNTVEIHIDAISPGEQVWLIDDVLATGGTANAAAQLVERLGGKLIGMSFLIELTFLHGREALPAGIPVFNVLEY